MIHVILNYRYLLLFFCLAHLNFAQQESQLNHLSDSIANLSKKEQIQTILNIPYDIALADIHAFERLSNHAIKLSKEIGDSLSLANSYKKKSLALHFSTKNEESFNLALSSIRIYEQLNKPLKIGETYCELAWRIKHLNLDKAFNYMRKGLSLREKYNDTTNDLYGSYDNYGVLLTKKKKWDSALYYHNKSLRYKKNSNDSIGIPYSYAHIASVYLNTEKYDLAKIYLDSSLVIRERRQDVYGIIDNKLYLGDLYFAKKEFDKAIINFEEALELSKKGRYFNLKKYATEYLYKSYDSISEFKNALKYNLLFNKLRDSVSNVDTNSRIAQLEIEFQTEKKEKEILSQRTDIAEKELSLNKKNTQLFGLGILALVLGALGYLFYNQQKLKNKQLQKEIELKAALAKIESQNSMQEQRLRISRDLHDNIGAQLTFIISSIDNMKYGFHLDDKINDKLKGISDFTKTTIYELRDTIWAMNKHEITFEDLQSRISNFIEKAKIAAQTSNFNFIVDDSVPIQTKFSSIQGMNLYRIIQEALNNSIKYAEATDIEVRISRQEDQLQIDIKDNGKGFDVEAIDLGNGIYNMKKRASDLQGVIQLESSIKKGTKVQLIMPLNT